MGKEIKSYRISSNRLSEFDYTTKGGYFITVCTKKHKHYFGYIDNGKMRLSNIGKIIQEEWLRTKELRENILLDEYIIMPNHFHGIIVINSVEATGSVVWDEYNQVKKEFPKTKRDLKKKGELKKRGELKKMTRRVISTTLKPKSLGSIMGQFKSICTKRIRALENKDFAWQANYYDHIIRDQKDLNRIIKYIKDNPIKWEEDKCYK